MQVSNIIRPIDDIERIVQFIKKNEQTLSFSLKAGSIIDMNTTAKPSVILIEKGKVSLYRKADDKLILNFQPPFPFGITMSSSHTEHYYMVCESDIKTFILNKDYFFAAISDNKIWMSILNIVTYLIDVAERQHQKYYMITNSYDVIKLCINEIWELSHDRRKNISIYDYVLSRYQISRSSITKILKSLNDGGYIVTKRATLEKVCYLPEKY